MTAVNGLVVTAARYKIPEQFLFVEDLPRNAMGKVVKRLVVPWFDGTVHQ